MFFYDRHGYRSLPKEEALAMHSHIADAFADWIGRSAHFDAVPLLLETGQQCMTTMQERHRQRVRPLEEPVLSVPVNESTSLGSSQLMGGIPTIPETQEGATEQETPRMNAGKATQMTSQSQTCSGSRRSRRRRGRRWVSTFLSRMAWRSRFR